MGKKTVKPKQPGRKQEEKPNLFEHIHNRKKFNVLGKKQKGERKHGKSRSDAVDKVCISCFDRPAACLIALAQRTIH